ncbi:unnamed protein product, partial [Amaranthus hypochondriacus]
MGKKKKVVINDDEYSIANEESEVAEDNLSVTDDKEEGEPISFVGKKKSKSSKKNGSLFNALLLEDDGEESGSLLEAPSVSEDTDVAIAFTGKKKSSKKKGNIGFAALGDDITNEMEPEVANALATNAEGHDSVPQEKVSSIVVETSKTKKKKKKGGKIAEEEDDLDKILAELGEGPAVSKTEPTPAPPAQVEKVEAQLETGLTEAQDEDDGIVESAAAKKKKKKKEKEKEKKAAAAAAAASASEVKEEVKNETKSKVADKKLPKHVREMQEALARRKEAEERKRKEEEEKLRKEEEERHRQEELARQAEEARLRKKEKEKEKLRLKKEAGLLLTAKQKEEQRRREIMKNQFLANAGIQLPASDNGAPTKRPIYTTKKSKSNRQAIGMKAQTLEDSEMKSEVVANSESAEQEKVEEVLTMDVKEKAEITDEIKENVPADENEDEDEDDDEDWDAKSWDDANLGLPLKRAFEDEEADSVTQSLA